MFKKSGLADDEFDYEDMINDSGVASGKKTSAGTRLEHRSNHRPCSIARIGYPDLLSSDAQ